MHRVMMPTGTQDVSQYFRRAQKADGESGLVEVPFGEYLVEVKAIDRKQLFDALMMQDLNPQLRIGDCVIALGLLSTQEVEALHAHYASFSVVEI